MFIGGMWIQDLFNYELQNLHTSTAVVADAGLNPAHCAGAEAERAVYLNALQGLVANRDAIESAVARVRKAADGYSDEELYRFARFVILSENAPSDWRQTQLKQIRNREDALEEIAMSIDHS